MLSRENSSSNHLKHACNITWLQAKLTDTKAAKERNGNEVTVTMRDVRQMTHNFAGTTKFK